MNAVKKSNNKKVCFITVNQVDLGIRLLSGVLKASGNSVRLINLATREGKWVHKYPDIIKGQLAPLVEDYHIIGISTVDMFLKRAEDLALWLAENMEKPVIMGGNHVELYPEESIQTPGVKAICAGQGVKTISELVEKWGTGKEFDIPDFWFKHSDGTIKKNQVLPPLSTKDYYDLPLPDYSYDDYWYLYNNEIKKMPERSGPVPVDQHQIGHPDTCVITFSQGCSNHCDFCNVAALTRKYREHGNKQVSWLRCKPIDRIIEEFQEIKKHNPNMKFIVFMDNNFAAHPLATLRKLADFMSKEIKLPFYCMASPNNLNREKLECLIKAGLKELNLGIESNAAINKKFYGRNISDEVVINIARLLNEYKDIVHPFYDFLIFNPAETEQDLLTTLELVRKLPMPFDLVTHHLTVAPVLPLYHRLLKTVGRLPRDSSKLYESNWHDADPREYLDWPTFYLNLLMEFMAGPHTSDKIGRLPRWTSDLKNHLVMTALKKHNPELADKLKTATEKESLDWLLRDDIRTLMQQHKNMLLEIYDKLPPIRYTNQVVEYRINPCIKQ